MNELRYSDDALNVKQFFYDKDIMVYVEGEEDVLFWEYMLDLFSDIDAKVQSAGGKDSLQSYITSIIDDSLSAIVALDSDYSIFIGRVEHDNILWTHGYAIENTIINKDSVAFALKRIGRLPKSTVDAIDVSSWIDQLIETTQELLYCDIHNCANDLSLCVMPTNCARFFTTSRSCDLDTNKINKRIEDTGIELTQNERDTYSDIISRNNLNPINLLRGHYLFSAIQRFISSRLESLGKRTQTPNDMLFATLMLSFEHIFDKHHDEYPYYKNIIHNISIS